MTNFRRDLPIDFRSRHPAKKVVLDNIRWEYITYGKGDETLLLLDGGLRIAETTFACIELFETFYRIIVPTYPPMWNIDELSNGIRAILDKE